MIKKTKGKGILPFLIIAALVLLFFNSQREDTLPSCEIPMGGGSCSINFTLEEGKAASFYKVNLGFDSIVGPETYLEPTLLTPLDQKQTNEEDSDSNDEEIFQHFLYGMPTAFQDKWAEIYSIKVNVTQTGTMISNSLSHDVTLDLRIGGILIPYSSDSIIICPEQSDTLCQADSIVRHYKWKNQFWESGYRSQGSQISSPIVDSYDDGTVTETKSLVLVLSGTDIHEAGTTKFLVTPSCDYVGGGTCNPVLPPTVEVSYRAQEVPTDVGYRIGSTSIDQFSGPQTESVSTLDIANQVNTACERTTDDSECIFELNFTSSRGGIVIINSQEVTLRLADVTPNTETNTSNQTGGQVVNDDTSGPSNNESDKNTENPPSSSDIKDPSLNFGLIIGIIVVFGIAIYFRFIRNKATGGKRR